jgi:hypothetical protein
MELITQKFGFFHSIKPITAVQTQYKQNIVAISTRSIKTEANNSYMKLGLSRLAEIDE